MGIAEAVTELRVESRVEEISGGAEGVQDFAAIYARRARDVFRYCLVYVRSQEEAEDVMSEAFERACRAWQAGRRPEGDELPWLLLIARRIVIDRARRKRLLGWVPLVSLPSAKEPAETGTNDRTEFWLWFDQLARVLTQRQRDVLLLRYQFDLPDSEIAPILGLSCPGVRSLAARAIAVLRQHPELVR